MSKLRLYFDEDASELAVVKALRGRNIDILTTAEAARLGASDTSQLEFAVSLRRAIFSFNVSDFARLHKQYLI